MGAMVTISGKFNVDLTLYDNYDVRIHMQAKMYNHRSGHDNN